MKKYSFTGVLSPVAGYIGKEMFGMLRLESSNIWI